MCAGTMAGARPLVFALFAGVLFAAVARGAQPGVTTLALKGNVIPLGVYYFNVTVGGLTFPVTMDTGYVVHSDDTVAAFARLLSCACAAPMTCLSPESIALDARLGQSRIIRSCRPLQRTCHVTTAGFTVRRALEVCVSSKMCTGRAT